MKIGVIGAGYVGLVSAACFSEMGNDVLCVEVNKSKVANLQNGIIPIYEPGLKDIVDKNYKKGNLKFFTDITDILDEIDICFIAVGTPMGENGSADLQYVLEVSRLIGQNIKHHMYIVNKSTVPIGTGDKVKDIIQSELNTRNSQATFNMISNPEFLKEGSAINDFMNPDRVVIGADSQNSFDIMYEIYKPFIKSSDRLISMDIKSSEMTKYAANAMLATKISFMNEIANICEKVGADVNMVRHGIGSDTRIGYSFIYPGCGYGGSCFPKDVKALIETSKQYGYTPQVLNSVELVNFNQKRILIDKIILKYGNDLSGLKFALWGLSFKPETDDMREATSIIVIEELIKLGASIQAYDPKAMQQAKQFYIQNKTNITYINDKYDALNDCDAMILITEWKEFRSPNWKELSNRLKNNVIFDGRNQYDKIKLKKIGFEYIQIGVK